ncbi:MAG: S9 family peptidase [Melioribacteraceae bacterium]|nr:S9 family peptidase [Melioribacteraceae bacterium]
MKKIILFVFFISSLIIPQSKRALDFKDIMKFRHIKKSIISEYGNWVAYSVKPDRGNGSVIVQSTRDSTLYSFNRGNDPEFTENEEWIKLTIVPDFAESERTKEKLSSGALLFNLNTNDTLYYNKIISVTFSENSACAAVYFENLFSHDSTKKKIKEHIGKPLVVRNLHEKTEDTVDFVSSFAFDSLSTTLSFVVSDTSAVNNGLYFYNLDDRSVNAIDTMKNCNITSLSWRDKKLAYLKSKFDSNGEADSSDLIIWDKSSSVVAKSGEASSGWYIPAENKLNWSRDGARLFFGYKKVLPEKIKPNENDTSVTDIFDFEQLLKQTTLDVWHWDDGLIKSNDKKDWKKRKKQVYISVYDDEENKVITLADESLPYILFNDNKNLALGRNDIPYLKLRTWDGWYNDYYVVDLKNGKRKKVAEKLSDDIQLSPMGKYVVYYNNGDWFLFNVSEGTTTNLTEDLSVKFSNEDHDYPSDPPGYGIAGWSDEDEAVFIYDKYDLWKFNTADGSPVNVTRGQGRINDLTFRVVKLDDEKHYFSQDEKLLLTAFHNKEKYIALYEAFANKSGVTLLIKEPKKFTVKAKAKHSEDILFTRETYDEYPDIWITSDWFKTRKKLSDLDKQREPFNWGKAELVEWMSVDSIPLQGVVIKPEDFVEGKKYPVLVYYYRFFSQRVHEFNDMAVNHRPNFPYYAGNGYIVFLPDIRFTIGEPGFSAAKCIVPGVQKLIDMGIADPNGIGLHGHSWSGYQTAFVVTITDKFACAIAGAPVSNMTSAYSGIRWGTGLARQFQYEKSQSRIGATLWEKPDLYIKNSPVFFADKINTPLLIQFGDEDDAVPWYQGIELYLAMRRLGKDCIFLQYNGEPHHLKKYPNKLDYSIKMKEYLDHYCKDLPAADWIKEGHPYFE